MKKTVTIIISICLLLMLSACSSNNSPSFYIDRAKLNIKKGKYFKAYTFLLKAKQLDPNNPKIWYMLGITQLRVGNINDAIKCEEVALQLNKHSIKTIIKLGYLYTISGHYKKAYLIADKLIKSKNYKIYGYLMLGKLNALHGEISAAKRILADAVRLHPHSYDSYLDMGNFYILLGDVDSAISYYRKAIQLRPSSPYAYVAMAQLYNYEKDLKNARLYLEKAIQYAGAKDLKVKYEIALGNLYLSYHLNQDALKLFNSLFDKVKFTCPEVPLKLVFTEIQLGEFTSAKKLLQRLDNILPNSYCVPYLKGILCLAEGNYSDASFHFKKASTVVTDSRVLMALAVSQWLAGYPKQAQATLTDAIHFGNAPDKSRLFLAAIASNNGQYLLSLSQLVYLLDVPENNIYVHNLVAVDLLKTGQLSLARRELRLIHNLHPKGNLLPVLEMSLLLKEHKVERALQWFKRDWDRGDVPVQSISIGRLLPQIFVNSNSPLLNNPIYCLYASAACLNAGDQNSADKLLSRIEDQETPAWLFLKASALIKSGKYQIAQVLLTDMISKRPNCYLPYNLMGSIYMKEHKYKMAADCFFQALKYRPDDPTIMNNRAWCLVQSGNSTSIEEARQLAIKAISLDPKSPEIMDTLGWIYYKLGMYSSGVQLVKQASSIVPDNALIKQHLSIMIKHRDQIGAF